MTLASTVSTLESAYSTSVYLKALSLRAPRNWATRYATKRGEPRRSGTAGRGMRRMRIGRRAGPRAPGPPPSQVYDPLAEDFDGGRPVRGTRLGRRGRGAARERGERASAGRGHGPAGADDLGR